MRALCTALAVVSLLVSVSPAQNRTVTVTGRAEVAGNNTMGARQQALNAAFRMAVESGVGVLVESSTLVKNAMLISDQIYSKAQGYVHNYDVVQEGAEGSSYVVKITAQVSMADLTTDLKSIGVLQDIMGNPKIMSVIEELVYDKPETAILNEDPAASNAVEGKLLASSFELVDAEQVKKIRAEEMARMGEFYTDSLLENDALVARIAQKAVEYGAQYLLMGTSRLEPVSRGGGVYTVTGTFKCKIVDAATAEKIAVSQKSESGRGSSLAQANLFAGQRAGESAAEEIIPLIVQNWTKRANSGVAYIIKVYGITSYGTQARKLISALGSVNGVTTCNKRTWDAKMGRIEFDVTYKGGSGDDLLDGIFAAVEKVAELKGFDLEEQTGNNMNFRIKK